MQPAPIRPGFKEQAGNHIKIGSAYLGSGQYNSAMKEFLEAERLTPDDPKVHFLLGIAYHGKGLSTIWPSEHFNGRSTSIRMTPRFTIFWERSISEKGALDDAIASFNQALANILYDTPATALYNLGRAYYEKGQYDPALKYYRDAAAREPDTVLMPLIEKDMGTGLACQGRSGGGHPPFPEIHRACPVARRIPLLARCVLSKAESARLTPQRRFRRPSNWPRSRNSGERQNSSLRPRLRKRVGPGSLGFLPDSSSHGSFSS